jgi:hypothetical protein
MSIVRPVAADTNLARSEDVLDSNAAGDGIVDTVSGVKMLCMVNPFAE